MNTLASKKQLVAAVKDDPRWAAIVTRDASADGQFYYSVKTTGIYCKPSCASRLAKPENVQFYESGTDAERAGFRPCLRCKPNLPSLLEEYVKKVTKSCQLIKQSETTPTLHTLAKQAGLSPYHFHRIFKAITGVTPKAYATAYRAQRVRNELCQRQTVTEAIFEAGYSSSGQFYAASDTLLGMTPSSYRAGGVNTVIRFAVGECFLGSILVAMSERGICAILLGDDPDALVRDLQDRFLQADFIGADEQFEKMIAHVIGFVETPTLRLALPLDIRGTAFQQRVWQALCAIPVGTTVSYQEIANRLGCPKAVRAVAQACGANTLAVAIPCHRVVRSDGRLSGYRWGVERKRALLEKEFGLRLRKYSGK